MPSLEGLRAWLVEFWQDVSAAAWDIYNWDWWNVADFAWDNLSAAADTTWQAIGQWVETYWKFVLDLWDNISTAAQEKADNIANKFDRIWNAVQAPIEQYWKFVLDSPVGPVFENPQQVVEQYWNFVLDKAANVQNFIQQWIWDTDQLSWATQSDIDYISNYEKASVKDELSSIAWWFWSLGKDLISDNELEAVMINPFLKNPDLWVDFSKNLRVEYWRITQIASELEKEKYEYMKWSWKYNNFLEYYKRETSLLNQWLPENDVARILKDEFMYRIDSIIKEQKALNIDTKIQSINTQIESKNNELESYLSDKVIDVEWKTKRQIIEEALSKDQTWSDNETRWQKYFSTVRERNINKFHEEAMAYSSTYSSAEWSKFLESIIDEQTSFDVYRTESYIAMKWNPLRNQSMKALDETQKVLNKIHSKALWHRDKLIKEWISKDDVAQRAIEMAFNELTPFEQDKYTNRNDLTNTISALTLTGNAADDARKSVKNFKSAISSLASWEFSEARKWLENTWWNLLSWAWRMWWAMMNMWGSLVSNTFWWIQDWIRWAWFKNWFSDTMPFQAQSEARNIVFSDENNVKKTASVLYYNLDDLFTIMSWTWVATKATRLNNLSKTINNLKVANKSQSIAWTTALWTYNTTIWVQWKILQWGLQWQVAWAAADPVINAAMQVAPTELTQAVDRTMNFLFDVWTSWLYRGTSKSMNSAMYKFSLNNADKTAVKDVQNIIREQWIEKSFSETATMMKQWVDLYKQTFSPTTVKKLKDTWWLYSYVKDSLQKMSEHKTKELLTMDWLWIRLEDAVWFSTDLNKVSKQFFWKNKILATWVIESNFKKIDQLLDWKQVDFWIPVKLDTKASESVIRQVSILKKKVLESKSEVSFNVNVEKLQDYIWEIKKKHSVLKDVEAKVFITNTIWWNSISISMNQLEKIKSMNSEEAFNQWILKLDDETKKQLGIKWGEIVLKNNNLVNSAVTYINKQESISKIDDFIAKNPIEWKSDADIRRQVSEIFTRVVIENWHNTKVDSSYWKEVVELWIEMIKDFYWEKTWVKNLWNKLVNPEDVWKSFENKNNYFNIAWGRAEFKASWAKNDTWKDNYLINVFPGKKTLDRIKSINNHSDFASKQWSFRKNLSIIQNYSEWLDIEKWIDSAVIIDYAWRKVWLVDDKWIVDTTKLWKLIDEVWNDLWIPKDKIIPAIDDINKVLWWYKNIDDQIMWSLVQSLSIKYFRNYDLMKKVISEWHVKWKMVNVFSDIILNPNLYSAVAKKIDIVPSKISDEYLLRKYNEFQYVWEIRLRQATDDLKQINSQLRIEWLTAQRDMLQKKRNEYSEYIKWLKQSLKVKRETFIKNQESVILEKHNVQYLENLSRDISINSMFTKKIESKILRTEELLKLSRKVSEWDQKRIADFNKFIEWIEKTKITSDVVEQIKTKIDAWGFTNETKELLHATFDQSLFTQPNINYIDKSSFSKKAKALSDWVYQYDDIVNDNPFSKSIKWIINNSKIIDQWMQSKIFEYFKIKEGSNLIYEYGKNKKFTKFVDSLSYKNDWKKIYRESEYKNFIKEILKDAEIKALDDWIEKNFTKEFLEKTLKDKWLEKSFKDIKSKVYTKWYEYNKSAKKFELVNKVVEVPLLLKSLNKNIKWIKFLQDFNKDLFARWLFIKHLNVENNPIHTKSSKYNDVVKKYNANALDRKVVTTLQTYAKNLWYDLDYDKTIFTKWFWDKDSFMWVYKNDDINITWTNQDYKKMLMDVYKVEYAAIAWMTSKWFTYSDYLKNLWKKEFKNYKEFSIAHNRSIWALWIYKDWKISKREPSLQSTTKTFDNVDIPLKVFFYKETFDNTAGKHDIIVDYLWRINKLKDDLNEQKIDQDFYNKQINILSRDPQVIKMWEEFAEELSNTLTWNIISDTIDTINFFWKKYNTNMSDWESILSRNIVDIRKQIQWSSEYWFKDHVNWLNDWSRILYKTYFNWANLYDASNKKIDDTLLVSVDALKLEWWDFNIDDLKQTEFTIDVKWGTRKIVWYEAPYKISTQHFTDAAQEWKLKSELKWSSSVIYKARPWSQRRYFELWKKKAAENFDEFKSSVSEFSVNVNLFWDNSKIDKFSNKHQTGQFNTATLWWKTTLFLKSLFDSFDKMKSPGQKMVVQMSSPLIKEEEVWVSVNSKLYKKAIDLKQDEIDFLRDTNSDDLERIEKLERDIKDWNLYAVWMRYPVPSMYNLWVYKLKVIEYDPVLQKEFWDIWQKIISPTLPWAVKKEVDHDADTYTMFNAGTDLSDIYTIEALQLDVNMKARDIENYLDSWFKNKYIMADQVEKTAWNVSLWNARYAAMESKESVWYVSSTLRTLYVLNEVMETSSKLEWPKQKEYLSRKFLWKKEVNWKFEDHEYTYQEIINKFDWLNLWTDFQRAASSILQITLDFANSWKSEFNNKWYVDLLNKTWITEKDYNTLFAELITPISTSKWSVDPNNVWNFLRNKDKNIKKSIWIDRDVLEEIYKSYWKVMKDFNWFYQWQYLTETIWKNPVVKSYIDKYFKPWKEYFSRTDLNVIKNDWDNKQMKVTQETYDIINKKDVENMSDDQRHLFALLEHARWNHKVFDILTDYEKISALEFQHNKNVPIVTKYGIEPIQVKDISELELSIDNIKKELSLLWRWEDKQLVEYKNQLEKQHEVLSNIEDNTLLQRSKTNKNIIQFSKEQETFLYQKGVFDYSEFSKVENLEKTLDNWQEIEALRKQNNEFVIQDILNKYDIQLASELNYYQNTTSAQKLDDTLAEHNEIIVNIQKTLSDNWYTWANDYRKVLNIIMQEVSLQWNVFIRQDVPLSDRINNSLNSKRNKDRDIASLISDEITAYKEVVMPDVLKTLNLIRKEKPDFNPLAIYDAKIVWWRQSFLDDFLWNTKSDYSFWLKMNWYENSMNFKDAMLEKWVSPRRANALVNTFYNVPEKNSYLKILQNLNKFYYQIKYWFPSFLFWQNWLIAAAQQMVPNFVELSTILDDHASKQVDQAYAIIDRMNLLKAERPAELWWWWAIEKTDFDWVTKYVNKFYSNVLRKTWMSRKTFTLMRSIAWNPLAAADEPLDRMRKASAMLEVSQSMWIKDMKDLYQRLQNPSFRSLFETYMRTHYGNTAWWSASSSQALRHTIITKWDFHWDKVHHLPLRTASIMFWFLNGWAFQKAWRLAKNILYNPYRALANLNNPRVAAAYMSDSINYALNLMHITMMWAWFYMKAEKDSQEDKPQLSDFLRSFNNTFVAMDILFWQLYWDIWWEASEFMFNEDWSKADLTDRLQYTWYSHVRRYLRTVANIPNLWIKMYDKIHNSWEDPYTALSETIQETSLWFTRYQWLVEPIDSYNSIVSYSPSNFLLLWGPNSEEELANYLIKWNDFNSYNTKWWFMYLINYLFKNSAINYWDFTTKSREVQAIMDWMASRDPFIKIKELWFWEWWYDVRRIIWSIEAKWIKERFEEYKSLTQEQKDNIDSLSKLIYYDTMKSDLEETGYNKIPVKDWYPKWESTTDSVIVENIKEVLEANWTTFEAEMEKWWDSPELLKAMVIAWQEGWFTATMAVTSLMQSYVAMLKKTNEVKDLKIMWKEWYKKVTPEITSYLNYEAIDKFQKMLWMNTRRAQHIMNAELVTNNKDLLSEWLEQYADRNKKMVMDNMALEYMIANWYKEWITSVWKMRSKVRLATKNLPWNKAWAQLVIKAISEIRKSPMEQKAKLAMTAWVVTWLSQAVSYYFREAWWFEQLSPEEKQYMSAVMFDTNSQALEFDTNSLANQYKKWAYWKEWNSYRKYKSNWKKWPKWKRYWFTPYKRKSYPKFMSSNSFGWARPNFSKQFWEFNKSMPENMIDYLPRNPQAFMNNFDNKQTQRNNSSPMAINNMKFWIMKQYHSYLVQSVVWDFYSKWLIRDNVWKVAKPIKKNIKIKKSKTLKTQKPKNVFRKSTKVRKGLIPNLPLSRNHD